MAAAGVNWSVGQTFTESKEPLMEAVKLCLEKGARRQRRAIRWESRR